MQEAKKNIPTTSSTQKLIEKRRNGIHSTLEFKIHHFDSKDNKKVLNIQNWNSASYKNDAIEGGKNVKILKTVCSSYYGFIYSIYYLSA